MALPSFPSSPFIKWLSRLALVCFILPAMPIEAVAKDRSEGVKLYYNQQYKKAAPFLMKEAKKGNAKAQVCLGMMYQEGLGLKQNYMLARRWYEKSAKKNRADAQTFLGMLYSQGLGVAKDFEKAKYWFDKAAGQGFALPRHSSA